MCFTLKSFFNHAVTIYYQRTFSIFSTKVYFFPLIIMGLIIFLSFWNWHRYQHLFQFFYFFKFLLQGSNSDTYLHPVAIFPDPFRRGKNKLILCDTYTYDHKPTETNKRKTCKYYMEKVKVNNLSNKFNYPYCLFY